MTCVVLQTGYQPIPGYRLKTKLGSGGYGEVWSADAPGGLSKAIKFVFGSVDEQRGATELRSLNRMRKLNHPFLLSIERVEIVDGQLVIVTELAQGSLYDRFVEYRKRGYAGIPRDRLIRYFSDAADGLDYLCQEHGLQHLDVKPGNLLLVADRVKVADFGLIKNLQSITQSGKNGMTPTYAPPEIFDGRPSRNSDQYSLAIAYVELLTGNLPFRGRTFAQLANEHLNKSPNLESIPLIERPVVAKALSKKPNLRYPDCREFIRALEACREDAKPASRPTKGRTGATNKAFDRSTGSRIQEEKIKPFGDDTQQVALRPGKDDSGETRPLKLKPPLPQVNDSTDPTVVRSLYLGLGGTGGLAIQALRSRFQNFNSDRLVCGHGRTLYIDTDQESVDQLTSMTQANAIRFCDSLTIGLKSSQYFRQSHSPDFQRLSRRWIFNIPRSQRTEGVRPLGMLAFLDNAVACCDLITEAIEGLFEDHSEHATLKVYLLASSHGGTGSAIVTEIGYLIRQIAASMNITNSIELVLTCANLGSNQAPGLEIASAVACLEEIEVCFKKAGLHDPLDCLTGLEAYEGVPFDFVTLINRGILGQKEDWNQSIEDMVDYVWAQDVSDLGPRLDRARAKDRKRYEERDDGCSKQWLGMAGVMKFGAPGVSDRKLSPHRCSFEAIHRWIFAIRKQIRDLQSFERDLDYPNDEAKGTNWISALMSSHQLFPATWIHQVKSVFTPPEDQDALPALRGQPEGAKRLPTIVDRFLDSRESSEIDSLARQMNIDSDIACDGIMDLVRSSDQKLEGWLDECVLTSLAGWKHLGRILGEIRRGLLSNADQILSGVQELQRKRDSAIEVSCASSEPPTPQFQGGIDSLDIEIRIHILAAKLLVRLARNIQDLSNRWLRQLSRLVSELNEIASPMMKELGIEDLGSTAPSEIAALVTQPYYRESIQFVMNYCYARLSDCWNLGSRARRIIPPECKDLRRIDKFVRNAVESHSDNVAMPDSRKGNQGHASDVENHPLQDRFGWDAVFEAAELAIESDHSTTGKGSVEKWLSSMNTNLGESFRSALPKLVGQGVCARNIMVIHDELEAKLNAEQRKQIKERSVTVIHDPTPHQCTILAIAEELDLDDILGRAWPISNGVRDLARRVHCTPG